MITHNLVLYQWFTIALKYLVLVEDYNLLWYVFKSFKYTLFDSQGEISIAKKGKMKSGWIVSPPSLISHWVLGKRKIDLHYIKRGRGVTGTCGIMYQYLSRRFLLVWATVLFPESTVAVDYWWFTNFWALFKLWLFFSFPDSDASFFKLYLLQISKEPFELRL